MPWDRSKNPTGQNHGQNLNDMFCRNKQMMGLGCLFGERDLLHLDGDPLKEKHVVDKQATALWEILWVYDSIKCCCIIVCFYSCKILTFNGICLLFWKIHYRSNKSFNWNQSKSFQYSSRLFTASHNPKIISGYIFSPLAVKQQLRSTQYDTLYRY